MCVCVRIDGERERERERDRHVCTYVYMYLERGRERERRTVQDLIMGHLTFVAAQIAGAQGGISTVKLLRAEFNLARQAASC